MALSLGVFGFGILQSTELSGEANAGAANVESTSVNAIDVTSITRNGSDIVVTFLATQGAIYRLERKLNLTDTTWQRISGVNDLTAPENGSASLTDPGAASLGKAFYRVTNQFPLAVTKSGVGTGSVTSSPAGIDCGADCNENYPPGSVVTLTATPSIESRFNAWGGACAGSGACVVTMDAATSVSADFQLKIAQGGFCSASPDCASGLSCVDNVCCNSTCSGTCEACNISGSVGTCSPVSAGQDPGDECGEISCSGYYYGWEVDSCYGKADVSGAEAACNGARACRTVEQECTAQTTRGSAQITCDSFCQDPTANTCVGTTAGTCTNVSQGNATCGFGPCQTSAPRCVNGAANPCVPNSGAASTETCNGIDDNCDATVDNGSFSDVYEANDSCASYRTLPQVGSDQTITQNAVTLYPSGDVDYYSINATESDDTCACCDFYCTDEDYRLTVTLTVPAGAGSYTFCTDSACGTVSTYCQTVNAGASASWSYPLDGSCGSGDSYSVYVRVSAGNYSPGFQCSPYTLSYFFDADVCL